MPPKKQDNNRKRPTTPKDRTQLEKDRDRKKMNGEFMDIFSSNHFVYPIHNNQFKCFGF